MKANLVDRDCLQNHFDFADVLNAVVPGYKKTVTDVQGGIAAGRTAAEKIAPIADYVSEHYVGLIIGLIVILVLSDLFAIGIAKQF